jgi:3-oxoacyl-[acyl-carrier protein] reductase
MSSNERPTVAIVTGGGSGIGRAIANRLAKDGAAVTVNDFHKERAEAVAREIREAGGRAVAIWGDVADESAVADVVAAAKSAFGDATLLVNCAGHVHQAPFLDIAPADFDRIFAVHVRGAYLCARAVLPAMLAAKSGVIINIASQLGQIGGVELAHYSAAKAAIIGLTKSLARE